jgi:trimeric autotransporter adhesin
MSNDTAKTITTNIVPVQGTFEPLPPYECINLIGPAGTPFFAPTNPNLDGVSITNSTINSTTIGVTTPALGAFTTASATNQPIGNNDLTTKLYVDSLALGISWKQPVVAATLANITLSGAQTIDTVAVVAGDRVLVKNQTAPAENGIYIVGTPWTRSPDANLWDELVSALVFVESGSQAGSAWYCPVQPGGTLGVTAITWNNFSVGGVYFAGTGLNLSGGDTFNITNTGVTAATYGSASAVPVIAVNQQGQITSASNSNIAIAASQVTSGTIDSARISGSYTGITAVGTLSGLTVSSTITGSISGNAATATTATSATSATTATNLAGGATGSLPYQSGAGATTFLAAGSNGQVLTLASGVPSWATPTTGTVTSVATAGTVNGLTLTGGPITGSGTVTLGGTLDLSAPPAIGGTTANTVRGTTITATTGFVGTNFDAAGSGGGDLRTSGGSNCLQWGGGGGVNVTVNGAINMNGANAAIQMNPTGTGTVSIAPAGALTVNPTTASTMNNVAIGGTTAAAAKVTTLDITSTLALNGSTGTAGYVLTSNGASAPTWQANANGLAIADDTTTNATRYLAFTSATTGNITTANVSSTKLQFNPSTGNLTSTVLTSTNDASISGLRVGQGNTAGVASTAFGAQALNVNTGAYVTGFGYQTLLANTSGTNNTGLGFYALFSNTTASNNTALGNQAMQLNTTGATNTAVGSNALYSNTTASNNTALGYISLFNNTTGSSNTAVGHQSLYSNTTGTLNVAVGPTASYFNTTGSQNIAIGYEALKANTTASNNVAVGFQSLTSNTTGTNNVATGVQALGLVTTGQSNTAFGHTAGNVISTGNNNVCIGFAAGSYSTPLTTGGQNLYVGTNSGPSSATVDYEMVITTLNSVGKGGSTGYINPQGGSMYQGNNTTTWATVSDRRIKKNIEDNIIGLEKITNIRVRNFEYRLPEEVDAELKPTDTVDKQGVQLGVIAQELQQVLPDCVKAESTGVLSVQTDNLIWYAINAIKELKAEIDQLKGN